MFRLSESIGDGKAFVSVAELESMVLAAPLKGKPRMSDVIGGNQLPLTRCRPTLADGRKMQGYEIQDVDKVRRLMKQHRGATLRISDRKLDTVLMGKRG